MGISSGFRGFEGGAQEFKGGKVSREFYGFSWGFYRLYGELQGGFRRVPRHL